MLTNNLVFISAHISGIRLLRSNLQLLPCYLYIYHY